MRDRLIELIKEGEDITPCAFDPECDCNDKSCGDCQRKAIADHLLANGVIVPPCKVGDTVYEVSRYYTGTWEVFECKVDEITIYETHIFLTLLSVKGNFRFGENISEINKNVFFAEKEALKRAKELRK